jgi:hypothetical protein
MCRYLDERHAMVCDVAIGRVREATTDQFGRHVRFTLVEGEGTRVEVDDDIDFDQFHTVLDEAVAKANA